ncbi:MAG TPA: hypothetical protein VJ417_09230, partial [Candidatus Glassbacteria bacterium]|nr:hypothetical protein [Candidatus Glassbacteria bacterium]
MWGVAGYGDGSNGPSQGLVSSRAYKGHATDPDMNHFVSIYPSTAGTLLDDCQTCHTGGDVTFGGKSGFRNACDFCHYIPFPDSAATGQPSTYAQTLNGFGLAYKHAGRNREAIEAIAELDSDGDGYSNEAEISDGRYPG